MITALMMVVCAAVIFAWLVGAAVFVGAIATGIVSVISRVRDGLDSRPEDPDSSALEKEFRDADVEFLHEIGIKL